MLVPLLMGIAPGDVAPGFTVKNQVGEQVRLSDFKGKNVLIYFYPKDDTPGCTQEACNFRDEYSKLKKMNTVILGVSRQGVKSHHEFHSKYKLPFDLLVDSDGSLAQSYGVGTMPVLGFVKRQSILIGPSGQVIRFYDDVDPSHHVKEVMRDIEHANTPTPH